MIRKIIKIDEEKCNGCGLCADACHEGAIGMVNGKAKLLRDDYCDGLGNCLPVCPTGAITFEEREALPYDEAAVNEKISKAAAPNPPAGGCPGSRAQQLTQTGGCPGKKAQTINRSAQNSHQDNSADQSAARSELRQWPVQIKLLPVNAPYLDGAHLLIAADCTAYARADFHARFMQGKITIIGCPKLDEGDYSEKLTAILQQNNIKSVSIVRMQVPCCGGLTNAAILALKNCGKMIPWSVTVLGTDGEIIEA
jgi:ferredoxin